MVAAALTMGFIKPGNQIELGNASAKFAMYYLNIVNIFYQIRLLEK